MLVQEKTMKSDRRNAIIAGILFLTGFSGVFIAVFTNPILKESNYLVQAAGQAHQMAWGAFFLLVMAFACAGISVFLYPVLRRQDEALALGAVAFRLIEAVLFVLSALSLLSLLSLGQEYVRSGMGNASGFQTLGASILSARHWTSEVLGILAWCLGAGMYHYIFYRSRIIPRWLSIWGLIGVPLAMAGCLLAVFQLIEPASPIQVVLNLPLGLQEIPLGVWLIVKGFDSSVRGSDPAKA
jgi:hypothetical protein